MHLTRNVLALSIVLSLPALAQTPATAALSGRVLSDEGRTVRAIVTLASSVANVFDQTGAQLQDRNQTSLQPATPAALAPLSYTLHRK